MTTNKDAVLNTMPHYTDERFRDAQTVFGEEETGLNYDYSDRLWQWNYDKAERATEDANNTGATPKTCRWYETFLASYYGKPIEIYHILAGWNWSNGFPYAVYGWKDAEPMRR